MDEKIPTSIAAIEKIFENEGRAQIASLLKMGLTAQSQIGFLSACMTAFCMIAVPMGFSEETLTEMCRKVYRGVKAEGSTLGH